MHSFFPCDFKEVQLILILFKLSIKSGDSKFFFWVADKVSEFMVNLNLTGSHVEG